MAWKQKSKKRSLKGLLFWVTKTITEEYPDQMEVARKIGEIAESVREHTHDPARDQRLHPPAMTKGSKFRVIESDDLH